MFGFINKRKSAGILAAALALFAIVSGCASKQDDGVVYGPVMPSPGAEQSADSGTSSPTEPFEALQLYQSDSTTIAAGYFEDEPLLSLIDNQTKEVYARNLYVESGIQAYETGENPSSILILYVDADTVDVFDLKTMTFLHRNVANYENYWNGGCGMIAVQTNGYRGYLSVERWEMAIPAYFEGVGQFHNNRAQVKENGKYGVIDEQGNYILKPEYTDIKFDADHGFIFAYTGETTVHLCNFDGQELLPKTYNGYTVQYEKLYALESGHTYADIKEWYALYDLDCNSLTGKGTELENISLVTLPFNGAAIGYGDKVTKNLGATITDTWFQYLDENAHPLSDKLYSKVTAFNSLGYAVALDAETYEYGGFFSSDKGTYKWVVLGKDGTVLHVLPTVSLGAASSGFLEANDYYAYGHGTSGLSPDKYALVDFSTNEVIYLPGPATFITGTNCIAVFDNATKLFCLYDGTEQVYDSLYSEIHFDMVNITLTRGGTTTSYAPNPRP